MRNNKRLTIVIKKLNFSRIKIKRIKRKFFDGDIKIKKYTKYKINWTNSKIKIA